MRGAVASATRQAMATVGGTATTMPKPYPFIPVIGNALASVAAATAPAGAVSPARPVAAAALSQAPASSLSSLLSPPPSASPSPSPSPSASPLPSIVWGMNDFVKFFDEILTVFKVKIKQKKKNLG
jgi:hypothetical protein